MTASETPQPDDAAPSVQPGADPGADAAADPVASPAADPGASPASRDTSAGDSDPGEDTLEAYRREADRLAAALETPADGRGTGGDDHG